MSEYPAFRTTGYTVLEQQIGRVRLAKLAELLRTKVAPKVAEGKRKFNMAQWGNAAVLGTDEASCETAGCACGWATTMPAAKKEGLMLVSYFDYTGQTKYQLYHRKSAYSGFNAAAQFFRISGSDAEYLFSPEGDAEKDTDPVRIADRLDVYLTQGVIVRGA